MVPFLVPFRSVPFGTRRFGSVPFRYSYVLDTLRYSGVAIVAVAVVVVSSYRRRRSKKGRRWHAIEHGKEEPVGAVHCIFE